MPYDPSDPETFRAILNRLADEQFLSSQKIIDLVRESRAGTGGLPPFDLTRNSLDRFKSGKRIHALRGLRETWLILEAHPEYSYCFRELDAQKLVATLPSVLPRFFAESVIPPYHNLSVIGDRIVGHYIMYRPHWRPRVPTGLARNSLVCVERVESGFKISELQNFLPTEEEGGFKQYDSGALAAFGKFIYFLMREETGTAAKFGLIDGMFPNSGDSRVDWFRGIVFTSSNLAIFPLGKFFCRRIDDERTVISEVVEISKIPDEDARSYLIHPLILPSS